MIEAQSPGVKRVARNRPLRMFPCESSLCKLFGYDPSSLELFVEFKDGSTGVYRGVTEERFHGFITAPSKGKYLRAEIWGKHESEKM